MIQIITPQNRHLYSAEIDSMFRLRYQVFVEDWGWKIPGISAGKDCDQYDTENTIYLIECAPNSEDVIVCARLNPTTKPHMYSETFPDLCNLQAIQIGDGIYEASRYAIDRNRLSARDLFAAKGRLEWSVTRYCLDNSIAKLTWLMSKEVYARNIQLWDTTPLGLPAHFDDDDRTYIPAISDITRQSLERISARYRLKSNNPICLQFDSDGRSTCFYATSEDARSAA